MPYTVANQKSVRIHREPAKSDFLGIKNENWQRAARDLRPHALLLYLYLAANADNYTLALSPAAAREAVGMPRSTYNDQIKVLIDKGYLVPSHGNTFDFYETPQPRAVQTMREASLGHFFDEECPTTDNDLTNVAKNYPTEDIEINNRQNGINNSDINIENLSPIQPPKVKEITIQRPKADGKDRPKYIPQIKQGVFEF